MKGSLSLNLVLAVLVSYCLLICVNTLTARASDPGKAKQMKDDESDTTQSPEWWERNDDETETKKKIYKKPDDDDIIDRHHPHHEQMRIKPTQQELELITGEYDWGAIEKFLDTMHRIARVKKTRSKPKRFCVGGKCKGKIVPEHEDSLNQYAM